MNARIGDSVLVRFEVVGMTEGSTKNLYPGIKLPTGMATAALDKLDVVSVEQVFRTGDWVQDKTGSDYGQITAIADGHAWVKVVGRDRPTTRDLRSVTRMDRK